ncbi:citrate synthase family protein [Acanthopleuribacter pedis]|uniref:citrate synthase (unknown stereospecificity) n=1 Tax=Acanthopleuribacter pedis TaxID=442870 RepID=A0A8J7Q9B0_9BACT|nr:citrate/2-methylcitrate synthase [Acanthopleuribacter pedis]MBO1320265.1 citrate synthase family protein [Acanthopleuribacter pedis]
MPHSADAHLITSKQAAEMLGISLPTLYAYVSRGLLQSQSDGATRRKLYSREQVTALKDKRDLRRDPAKGVAQSLQWGPPLLDSAVTQIREGRFYYRGRDACLLAETTSFEALTAWLWGELCETPLSLDWSPLEFTAQDRAFLNRYRHLHPCDRLQLQTRLAAAADPVSQQTKTRGMARRAARLLATWTDDGKHGDQPVPLATRLARRWSLPPETTAPLLNAVLILCADHELNISSFTARCVASAGTGVYEIVSAGLSALRGVHHGGFSDRVEALLRDLVLLEPDAAERDIQARLNRGEAVPGFAHPFYPAGDPRFSAIRALVLRHAPDPEAAQRALDRIDLCQRCTEDPPTLDSGLALVSVALGLPPHAAWFLFAVGRTVGWVAHGIEQVNQGRFIRPRANYTGPPIEDN